MRSGTVGSGGKGTNGVTGSTLFANAFLVDCAGGEPVGRASVVVECGRIRSVRRGGAGPTGGHKTVYDCAGMPLMPGLTDAHVHIGAVDVNILEQPREYPSNLAALMMAGSSRTR